MKTALWLVLAVGGFFIVLYLFRHSRYYAPTGQIGVAGGAIPLPPASSTASSVNAILAGTSATLPSILGAFKGIFGKGQGPTSATGVAGTGYSPSNVPDSYTSSGPVTLDSEGFNVDYNTDDLETFVPDDSLEYSQGL